MEIEYYKPCPEYDRCCELIDRYWEAGEYEVPFKVAIQLAEYYNVSVDYIAGITNETKPYPRVK